MTVVKVWGCGDMTGLVPELAQRLIVGNEEIGEAGGCREDVPI